MELPSSIIVTVALLTAFLIFARALTYAVPDPFKQTRLIMTAFFIFIVATLTVSFWEYALFTLPYTATAFALGAALGWLIGVRGAETRIRAEGLGHYIEHFSHIHIEELRQLTWWSVINFYSVAGALLLINFVGLSTVIFHEARVWALITSILGACLLGTIFPYLIHVWSINPKQANSKTQSE